MFDYSVDHFTPQNEIDFLKRLSVVAPPDKFAQVVSLIQTREYPGWHSGDRERVYAEAASMVKK